MTQKDRAKKIFDSHYEKKEGCWIWKGVIGTRGYGKIGSKDLAHRRAYEYAFGNIPKDKLICHKCDNKLCVNPDHFFLGSIAENMKDKVNKNRQAKGSKISSSKLTEENVLEIRRMRIDGKEYQEIADKFGVVWDTIKIICKNRQWKHVGLGVESAKCKRIYSSA